MNDEDRKTYMKEFNSRPENRAKRDKHMKEYVVSIRRDLLDIYGWKCACCGEDNASFLTLDHINGDGYKERAERGGGLREFRRAIKSYDPTKYQILCYNCNQGRAHHGIDGLCPHKLPKSWKFAGPRRSIKYQKPEVSKDDPRTRWRH
jgi:hypothetical protein